MKPQELAPDARPRQSSSISNELWYGRLIVTKTDSKGGRGHQKRETPQGGDLNGGLKKPRSANFSISSAVDPVFTTPLPHRSRKNAFVRKGKVRLGLALQNPVGPALGANPTNPAANICPQMKGEPEP